ncbi:trypco2 family protein [Catenulispora rubra]|uniref:trypco2 family protein n=1 Tax=Catenulispora rubra TaxID=280293 RepID=UPI00189212E7|nr:trypco2 family protein [Catenulispora rubra]
MIELTALIRQLRMELQEAVVAGDGAALRFELGPIELEVVVAVERSAETGSKLRFLVAEAHADGKWDATRTQRIKLTLTPKLDGTEVTALIAGTAEPGEE